MAAVAALQQSESFGDFAPGELDARLEEGERSMERDGSVCANDVYDDLRQRSDTR